MTARSFDVVVVGNGTVGLCTAAAVARRAPDLSVAVVGPSHRAGGASPAAGAMLGCFGEVTRHTQSSEPGRLRFNLQLAAHRRWPAELADLAEHSDNRILLAEDTFLVLNARGGALDSDNLDAVIETLDDHAWPYENVSAVPGLDPTPDARPLRILRLLNEGAVHSGRLLQAQERRAAHVGVTSIDASARRLDCVGSAVRGVELADSSVVTAGQVVLAVGAFTTPFLADLPDRYAVPPVLAGSGVALVAERVMGAGLTSPIRTVTRAGSCGLHVVPLGSGVEYFGATNVIFGEPENRPHVGVCLFLSECAIDQIDRSVSYSRIDEVRIGNRPVPFDTFPLLGPGPVAGLWVLTGGYRDGLHSAPEVAEMAARSIIGGLSCFPEAFRPCRPPISTMTVEESIEDFLDQQVASAFEGGARLSPFQHPSDLARIHRPQAEALYVRLGVTVGLATDVLTFLCVTRKSEADVEAAATYLASAGAR